MSNYLPDMRAGDDYNIQLTVNDLAGVPVNITGYKFWFTVKTSFSDLDANAIFQFVTTVGDNANDVALSGICFISVPAAVTKLIAAGSYFYDIQQKAGVSGGLTTVLPPTSDYKDKLVVIPEITRAIS